MRIKKAKEEDEDKEEWAQREILYCTYVWKMEQGLFKFQSDIQFTLFDKGKNDEKLA